MSMTLYRYLKIRGLKTEHPDDMRLLKHVLITKESGPVAERPLVYKVSLTASEVAQLRSEHPELNFHRPGYAGKGV